jgi:hypothetical protein
MIDPESRLFYMLPQEGLASRLINRAEEALLELADDPAGYLLVALSLDSADNSLTVRLFRQLKGALLEFSAHPVDFVRGAFWPDLVSAAYRRRIKVALAASATLHAGFAGYLIYMALISPLSGLKVVDKPYRELDIAELLKPLHYPRQMLRGPGDRTLSLEEIRERERRRKEERRREEERRRREQEERRREEERRRAEMARAEEEKKKSTPMEFKEINLAPIRDIIGRLYDMHQAGQLDIQDNFSIMASFKVEPDGSISNIRILKSSGSKVIDENAIKILWNLGESHALGPLSDLSSNTIRLDLMGNTVRLTITSFAPTPNEARAKVEWLKFIIGALRISQQSKSPEIAELLSLLKLKYDNNRIDADLTVSRARATEMMRGQFGKANMPQPEQ